MSVLVVGDLAAFWVVREFLRLLGDPAVVGDLVAGGTGFLFPDGFLGGWRFAAALVVGLAVTGTYARGVSRREPSRILLGCALAAALSLWGPLWDRGVQLVAAQFVGTVVLAGGLVVLARLLIDKAVPAWWPRWVAPRAVLVGARDSRTMARMRRLGRGPEGYSLVGHVAVNGDRREDSLGPLDELPAIIARYEVDTVIASGSLTDEEFTRIVDVALTAGCELMSFSRSFAVAGVRPALVWRGQEPLVRLTAPELQAHQRIAKRAMDLVLASIALVLGAPLMVLVAIVIKATSRGPVLFRQERVGRGGRRFRILKFRTMHVNAESMLASLRKQSMYSDPRLFKLANDPRVTKLGALLRRTSIDELPQLFNVLRGSMSLVGPRPPIPSEVALYHAKHYCRFDVKPGMTGPWQVNGRNRVLDFEEVVRLEVAYIRNWSLLLDLSILVRTVPVVLSMEGAH